MTYDELLAQHGPSIRADADKITSAVSKVVNTLKGEGGATVKLTQVFMALVPLVTTLTTFVGLDAEGKALVFAEAFDASVGTEDTALVKEFMIFGTEETEEIGDTLKKVVFKVFHKKFLEAEAATA
jgi:hypothetical protein